MRVLPPKPPTILCESQTQALGLDISSKLLIEITNPRGRVEPVIGSRGFKAIPAKEFGFLTVLADGISFTGHDGFECPDGYEYLQGLVSDEMCVIRFALPANAPIWYAWGSIPWQKSNNGTLTIQHPHLAARGSI